MDTLTFISNTIGQVISWPMAIIGVALLFHGPLSERLKDVKKIKTKYFEADFGETLEKVADQITSAEAQIPTQQPPPRIEVEPMPKTHGELLERLTELMPNAAILESWRNVERTLDLYFVSRGIEKPKSGQSILGHLDYDPNFPPQLVSAYQELRVLRNLAAHSNDNVSANQAHEFFALAARLTLALINASEI